MATMTLDSFLAEAEQGQEIIEKLRDGNTVKIVVKAPAEDVAFGIRKILQEVITANKTLTDGAAEGERVVLDDPGIFIRLRELDSKCLIACVDQLNTMNVMALLDQLDEDSKLLKRVKELCGVDIFTRQDGDSEEEEEDSGN